MASETIEQDNDALLQTSNDNASTVLGGLQEPSCSGGAGLRAGKPGDIAIAMDPVALIISECITVTSAMRKHSRWAHSSVAAILGGGPMGYEDEKLQTTASRSAASLGSRLLPGSLSSKGDSAVDDDYALQNRWGLRGKKGKSLQDNPLMSAFTRLRAELKDCKDIRVFDTPSLLHPFLQVIRSSSTSAPITSLALVAITKFFRYNIITKESPRLSMALQLLSAAVTHCRFEATDSAADEIVLLRILRLMEDMMTRPEGELLGDESVCEMMETGLSMCCQVRLSEVLRRSAEMAMVNMCQVIFERLAVLKEKPVPEASNNLQPKHSPDDSATLKMAPSVDGTTVNSQHPTTMGSDAVDPEKREDSGDAGTASLSDATAAPTQSSPENLGEDYDEVKPYSIPSIRELFRVLIDLLDPHNPQHTDTMRIMSLRIIDVALEVAGPAIASHQSLAQLAKDDLCRYLFQLVRSENIGLLNSALRVTGTLLMTCRHVLKLQQELYLSYLVACLHPKVDIPLEPGIDPELYAGIPQSPKLAKRTPSNTSSGRSTPIPVKDRQRLGMEGGTRKPEAREAMVESLCSLVRMPTFMVELFVNYDCEVDRTDLCEDMIGLLSRNAFPDSATWSTTNVPPLCLDALLSHVQYIADRLDKPPSTQSEPDPAVLRQQRETKKIIIRGAQKFNEDPKSGISYLSAQGIIKNIDDPNDVASFLKGTSRVSKQVLGEYLSKRSNENLLDSFMELFDWQGKDVVEALRELLGSFRLPGEAALIDRILTIFSDKYVMKAQRKEVADKDSLFVLTYAIIMLNTNLYNPNVKAHDRMSCPAFAKNLSGCNGGGNFDESYLNAIYTAIEQNEIILPEEHESKHAFDFAWKELLLKTAEAGDLALCSSNAFDAEMFQCTWRPVVATLSYVFMSATDDAVFSRVVTGFDQCAKIATKYGLPEVLDRIIFCLGSMSSLVTEVPPNTSLNTEVEVAKKKVMVSELAVRLGRDFRAQLATVVLFRVLSGSEHTVRDGWDYVLEIFRRLFVNSLIPQFDHLKSKLDLPPIPLQNPSSVINRDNRNNDTGLLSAFTSYLAGYAADEPPEPSDEELENTLCTVDCINACSIPGIVSNISTMPVSSVQYVVNTLLSFIPESSPSVITIKSESPGHSPRYHRKANNNGPVYDPAMLYCLEFATILTLRDEKTLECLGEALTTALQGILRSTKNYHQTIVARSISYLLETLSRSFDHSFVRAPVILHSISSFEQGVLETVCIPVMTGLKRCVNSAVPLRNEVTRSPDFWSILQRLHRQPEAAPFVFNLLQGLVKADPPAITADNYESAVSLANDFANAGSLPTLAEKNRDLSASGYRRNPKPVRQQSQPKSPFIDRGINAIGIIDALTAKVPPLIEQSHLVRSEAWAAYWSPIFSSLSTQCLNPTREIRHHALNALQRTLLSPEIASGDHKEWIAIFGEVLFPLISRLLKPEIYQSDPIGMAQTRVQTAMLVCKVFLHYLVLLSEWDEMVEVWLKILDILDRMMNSGQDQSLEEAIPESLKNILLVMANGGYIARPTEDPSKEKLWVETQKRLDRFLPDLFKEIFAVDEQQRKSETKEDSTDETQQAEEEKEKPAVAQEEAS